MVDTSSLSTSTWTTPTRAPSPSYNGFVHASPAGMDCVTATPELASPTVVSTAPSGLMTIIPSMTTVTVDGRQYPYDLEDSRVTLGEDEDASAFAADRPTAEHAMDARANHKLKPTRKPKDGKDQAATTTTATKTATRDGEAVCSLTGHVYSGLSEWPPCETATQSAGGSLQVPGAEAVRWLACALHGAHAVQA